MSGLVLKLAPGERFVINGAVLENGDRLAHVRVTDTSTRVLRMRDALRPEEVTTPVRRVYYAVQLLITGDLTEEGTVPAIDRECGALEGVFETIDADMVPTLRDMVQRANYYSALCHMRKMLVIENELLAHAQRSSATAKVA